MSGSATRITNNQITVGTIDYTRIASGTLVGSNFNPNLTLNSNVSIVGNLSVSGNTTTVNSTDTYINDPVVVFNNGYTGSLTGYDIGILMNRNLSSLAGYGSVNTFFGWVEGDSAFEAFATTGTGAYGTSLQNLNNSGFANIKAGNIFAQSGTVTATNIYASTIGNTSTTLTGTLSTAAQPNVTSLGTLTSLAVTNATTIGGTLTVSGAITGNTSVTTPTVTATTVNAATIGNTGATLIGTLTSSNIAGTVATANVSLYDAVTAYTTNQSFYPMFSNISATGNTITGVSTNLSFNPSSGNLTASYFVGSGQYITNLPSTGITGTVPTANVALYEQVTATSTNATYYPMFGAISTTGNTAAGVNSSLSYNPSTGTLSATTLYGTVPSGNIAGTVATANVALYDQVTNTTTNASFYPMFSATSSTGNTAPGVNTNLSFNPSTGVLTATTLYGTVPSGNIAGTVATANVALYDQVTATSTNASFYPMFSATSSTGNTAPGVNSGLSFNPSTGTLTATYLYGTVPSGNIAGTVATANVALYDQVTATSTNASFYPMLSATSSTGNTAPSVNSSLSYNPSTGTLTATTFSGTVVATNISGTVATANVALYDQVTATSTNASYYPMFSATSSTGNTAPGVSSSLSYNPSTGTLSATYFTGTVLGTIATANVAYYENVNAFTTNQTFYPMFSNISATGNTVAGVNSSLSYNPSTGTLTATNLYGTVPSGNIAGTVATANVALYEQVTATSTNASYYPMFSATSSTGNTAAGVNSSLSYNPSTGTLSATNLYGTVPSGNIAGTVATANVALYDQITNLTNNQTYYLEFANVTTGNSITGAVTTVNVNPSTGTVYSTAFNGTSGALNSLVLTGSDNNGTQVSSGALQITGGAGISGNLYVQGNVYAGNLISTQSQIVSVLDPLLYLSANTPTNYNYEIGFYSHFGPYSGVAYQHTGFVRDHNTGIWKLFANTPEPAGGTVNFTNSTWDALQIGSLIAANTTAATGNGSTTSGALYVAGGAGVAGAFYAGSVYDNGTRVVSTSSGAGNLTISGTGINLTATGPGATTFGNATYAPQITTDAYGRITSAANVLITVSPSNITGTVATANVSLYDQVTATSTNATYYPMFSATSSTGNTAPGVNSSLTYNPSTGALGTTILATSGTITAGGNIVAQSGTASTSTTTGALVVNGGAGITGAAYIGGALSVTGATTLTTTTTGGLQAVAIGNVTPGTAAFTTATTGSLQGIIGNVTPTTAFFTTANATNVYAATIGNVGTTLNGTLSATNVSGTVATANVALYEQVTALSNNQTYYPMFSNVSATGNTTAGVNSSLSYNPSTGTLSATTFSGTVAATNISGTVATAGVSLQDQIVNVATNNTFYLTFANATSGNSSINAVTTVNVNPSTGNVYATAFVGSGQYITNLPSTSITGTVPTANVSYYANVTATTTNATYYPALVNATTGNLAKYTASTLSYNPSTGNLLATAFVGAGTYLTGNATALSIGGSALSATTATNATNVTVGTASGSSNYVTMVNGTSGNLAETVSSALTFNATTGTLTASAAAVNGGTVSNSTTTGALVVTGGVGISGNAYIGNSVVVGTALNYTPANAAIQVGFNVNNYGQVAIQNINSGSNASSDFAILANNGSDNDTYVDLGILSSTYSQSAYSIYYPNDAYLISAGNTTTKGGNLVVATTQSNDIVFATGGQNANNEVMRVTSGNVVKIRSTTVSANATSGALTVAGGTGIAGNLFVGNASIFNSTQTAGMDHIVRGVNDSTLLWARPNATYDSVIIGNSATASTAIVGSKLVINTTDSIMLPVGTASQRPGVSVGTATTGMLRYSTTAGTIEWYNGTSWQTASTQFTVIVDNQFTGTGSQTAFTLTQSATTASAIVSINGVVQIPTVAYTVSGTTLTLSEAPLSTDVIDVRILTTTQSVTTLSSATAKAQITVDDTAGITFISANGAAQVFQMPIGGGIVSSDANVSVASANTATTIDTVSNSTYRSAKYMVQVTNGTNFQTMEALVVQNGTTATISAYNVVSTGGNLGILTATVSGGNTLVQFTAANATNTVRTFRQYLPL